MSFAVESAIVLEGLGGILAALGFSVPVSESCLVGATIGAANPSHEATRLFHIGVVLRCASVCQAWSVALRTCVTGVLVPPVLLQYVEKSVNYSAGFTSVFA